jgi:glycosyltransferase involved in cell wall biosynthesis
VPGRVVIFGWADSIHVQRWVRGLSERGWQIRLISLGGEPVTGAETIILKRHGRLSYYWHGARAVRLAREFKPDLVHVHYAGGFGLWGARCDFAPVLTSVWGSDIVNLPHDLIHRFHIRRVLRKSTRVTATSAYLRRACVSVCPDVSEKIDVIPFGVVIPAYAAPMPAEPVRLCFIKLHRPIYGPDVLLRALASVRVKMPDIELTLAGAGEMTPRLRRMTLELGLDGNVEFVGLIPHVKIYSLLQEHHIMVMPSREEAFGVAVLEAAACGRPVIASRVGGVPEVLRDGETGLLVPPGDEAALAEAILRLARDLETCRRMGEAGRSFVQKKYLWENSLDRMTRLYESIIHGH